MSDEAKTFLNHIAATGIVRIVEAPDGLGTSFRELLERGPFLIRGNGSELIIDNSMLAWCDASVPRPLRIQYAGPRYYSISWVIGVKLYQ